MKLADYIELYKTKMLESWETLPEIFITSSETKLGREEILAFIEKLNKTAVF
jgi:GTP-binding protein